MSTLANARDVLRLLADQRRALTVTEMAHSLGIPKSSTSRTLAMMANLGFLERDPVTLAYRPGILIEESATWQRHPDATITEMQLSLAALVRTTGYTGYLNVLDGDMSLVICMRTGRAGRLQVYTPEGTRGPAYGTSMGRAMLARLDDAVVADLIGDNFGNARGSAPRTTAELLSCLATVRDRGVSFSRGEFVHNVAGISAAVCDQLSGRPIGIGIALPADEVAGAEQHLGDAVLGAASRVGHLIGDPYWMDFTLATATTIQTEVGQLPTG
ncbi:MAG: IclR family transcriptional regulator [Propioniciclava sp.]